MFKKSLFFILIAMSFNLQSDCITIEQGKEAFNQYVEQSNKCSDEFRKMYDNDTVIKRIVTKADGTTYEKKLSVDMYKTMLKYYSKIALWQGYRNEYTDLSFKKNGDNVEVNGIRHPSTSDDALKAKIVFGENEFGRIVIKEECFHTNASFLVR